MNSLKLKKNQDKNQTISTEKSSWRKGQRYGKSDYYNVPTSPPLRTNPALELFPAVFMPTPLHPVDYQHPAARLIKGEYGKDKMIEESLTSSKYSHSNARHPNDPINKTTH